MKNSAARSKARRFAMQALYQAQMSGDDLFTIERQFHEDNELKRVDTEYLHEVLNGVAQSRDGLWEVLVPLLDRDRAEVGAVEQAILCLGAYELLHRINIPYRVVINEGVELARMFGANESYKFINSVLDGVARSHRQVEMGT